MPSATIAVRVQPRARRDEIVGVRDGVLVVRVTAPPVDGRANEAVSRVLAQALGVRASSVGVRHGARSRDKLVGIEGLDQASVDASLGL